MSDHFNLSALARTEEGKGASRRLRKQNLVPAVIYGGKEEPTSISLRMNELVKALEFEAFFSHILTLDVNGKEEQVVIKDLQRHPAKNFPMHADFMRIVKGQAITVSVPLHYVGTKACPGIKAGGVLDTIAVDVEISTLPSKLPEYLEVDVSKLEKGEALHLSDIQPPEGVSIVALSHGEDHDQAICIIQIPRGPKSDVDAEEETVIEADGDSTTDSSDTEE